MAQIDTKNIFELLFRQTVSTAGGITASTTYPSTFINVAEYDAFAFVVDGGSNTVSGKVEVLQAVDSSGTGSAAITGASGTKVSTANTQLAIVVSTNVMNSGGSSFVAMQSTATLLNGAVEFLAWKCGEVPVSQPSALTVVKWIY